MRKVPWGLNLVFAVTFLFAHGSAHATEIEASEPQSVTIALYDLGFAFVSELRRVALADGDNSVRIGHLPASLDPATISFVPARGGGDLEALEHEFHYDLSDPAVLFNRYMGREITVDTLRGRVTGILLKPPLDDAGFNTASPIVMANEDGSSLVIPRVDRLREVVFPNAQADAFLEPTLIWRARSGIEELQNLRLSYVADRVHWEASYEAVLNDRGDEAFIDVRIGLSNNSGGAFKDARVRLVSTEKGQLPDELAGGLSPAHRYPYGVDEPSLERLAASAGLTKTYEMPRAVTLDEGRTKTVYFRSAANVPVAYFYVYDGVKFDRYKRNRRNDWNYGTEHQETIETHVAFENVERVGLGLDLPPGRFRLYQQGRDEMVDLIGDDRITHTAAGETAHVLVGPARGLRGERERTGYREVRPLHEYEESFEIRLSNASEKDVNVRVVEHLYRWNEFEIVKADTEYTMTGPQTIEFHTQLNAGGKRSVYYTVRYRW